MRAASRRQAISFALMVLRNPFRMGEASTISQSNAVPIARYRPTDMASSPQTPSLFSRDQVQAVLVGCDRVAANGDVANKIGTAGVAILAKYYNIPFYVCCPSSTIDMACPNGAAITIEERKPEEVTEMWYAKRMAPPDVGVFNPAFDVADNQLVTAIITEEGVLRPPYETAFTDLFAGKAKIS